MKYEEALIYASGLMFFNALNSLIGNQNLLYALHSGMKIRIALCSLIYRKVSRFSFLTRPLFSSFFLLKIWNLNKIDFNKALRLSQTALTAPGQVMNLLSNDVSRFEMVTLFLNFLWTAPSLTLIIGVLLWFETKMAGLIGIGIIFIVVPIQSEFQYEKKKSQKILS